MGDNKDKNYNDTNKQEGGALAGKKSILGMVAEPGLQYQSTIVTTACSCGHVGPTTVLSAWNLKSYICCYYCGCYWWCWQTLKGKDYTLKDGLHSCGKCGTEISDYKSCE